MSASHSGSVEHMLRQVTPGRYVALATITGDTPREERGVAVRWLEVHFKGKDDEHSPDAT